MTATDTQKADTDAGGEWAFKRLGARLSNWGRWGEDDELGTVNFITDDTRAAAAGLIRTGKLIDLGMPFDVDGPQPGNKRRGNPIHTMLMLPSDDIGRPAGMTVADDMISLATQCATQWDSLAHVGYDGLLWNNVPNAAVSASGGVTRNSFDKVVSKLVGRGVLLDVAALKGVDVLGYSEEITADDLSAAAERQGVEVRSGDIVLVRTGWYRHFLAGDRGAYMSQQEAGLGISCCQWLTEREVAVIACDNYAVEVKPSTEPPATHPLHMVLIRDVGMTLGEMFNMEELATTCADEGRWEFFFSGVGLKITSSAGSPITPVAIF